MVFKVKINPLRHHPKGSGGPAITGFAKGVKLNSIKQIIEQRLFSPPEAVPGALFMQQSSLLDVSFKTMDPFFTFLQASV